ncbi:MAG: ABC transporter substrate-binding protein [Rhodospirillaceae bacterium]
MATAVPAVAADKITVAVSQRGTWDPTITQLAEKHGFFKAEGIEATFSFTAGGTETVQAIATGTVDIATPTSTHAAIAAFAKGAPIRIIGSRMLGSPDLFWYVRADSPLKSVKDIAGKSLAYSRPASVSHMIVLALQKQEGVQSKLVQTGAVTATRTLVMTGQVDVGWSSVPIGLEPVMKGEVRMLFRADDAREMAGVASRVTITSVDFLAKRRDVARRFMVAHEKAVDWMYQGNMDAAAQILAEDSKIDIAAAREAAKFFKKENHAMVPIHGLEKAVAQTVESGMLKDPLTPAQMAEIVDIVHRPKSN